ncbi:MAG: antifreeze protein [Cypionkella sp.]|nr:antifreeze protein [Cypionkella sp.]MDB5664445.1 antifreeze protein [Cypionkella sp.]
MLPAVSNIKRNTVAILTALAIALPAAPALAWGQREQDVLKGAAGVVLLQGIIRETKPNKHHNQPRYENRPRYEQRYEPRYERQYEQPRYQQYAPRYEQPRVSVYNTAAARAFNSFSSSERRLIQRRLSSYGYYRGGIDGSFGPGTYNAVVAYAGDQGQTRQLGSTNSAYGVYDGLIN